MDNRIANDMISSGMIPSGEKKKEDLGRTQYGSAPSPNALLDAYKSMYDKKEEVINEHHKKDADGNTIPHEHEEELNEGKIPAGLQAYLDKKKGKKEDKKDMKEENIDEVAPLLAAPLVAKGLMALKGAKVGAAALKGAAAFKKGLMTAKGAAAAGKITTTGGKVLGGAQKVGMAQKTGSAVRTAGAAMKNNPMSTALVATSFKPAPKMPSGVRDPRAKMTGARTAGVYASADLFDIVKGQLLDEGIDEKEALKIMVELSQQDLNDIVNEKFDIGKVRVLPAMAKLGTAALVTQQIASRMGKKSGEESIKPDKPNKPSLMQKIKTQTDTKNKAIEQM